MITQKILKENLHYDPDTGIFTRKTNYNSFQIGDVTGSVDSLGYLILSVKGHRVKAHRAAIIYMYGSISGLVDHINGIKTDNRIVNIRIASSSENSRNTKMMRRNTSGFNGVCWSKNENKWQVRVTMGVGKRFHIGYFKCKLDAIAARIRANKEYGYHDNHGLSEDIRSEST